MALAKFLLIAALVIAIVLGLLMRFRAWRRQRAVDRSARQAELDRLLRD